MAMFLFTISANLCTGCSILLRLKVRLWCREAGEKGAEGERRRGREEACCTVLRSYEPHRPRLPAPSP